MARKTKKQTELTQQVQKRLTGEAPVRLDAQAVQSGGERGSTKTLSEIHPSLESATSALEGAGLQGGTVTTGGGLSVRVSRANSTQPWSPQAPELGSGGKSAGMQEGVSQRFETPIGRDQGPHVAAKHAAEAEAIARRPNPLRSDGLVDAVMAVRAPSVGGNRLGHGGALSGLAKMEDAYLQKSRVQIPKNTGGGNFPSLQQEAYATGPRDLALKVLGYTDEVQNAMLATARSRISRRQGRAGFAPLSPTEVTARAHGQVQEHLDEALHGTKRVGHEEAVVREAVAHEGMGIETAAGQGTLRAGAKTKGGGLGMTKSRTPNQRAQRATVAGLVRGGKWNALRDPDALDTAVKNDLDLMTAQQKARRASGPHPETFNTMAPGADVEQASRRHQQPVFSTGPRAPWASTSTPGVGVLPEKNAPLAPSSRPGAVSPVPPNLPSEPAKIGRSREERGLKPSTFPTGSEPVTKPTPGKMPAPKKVSAGGASGGGIGNWSPSAGLAPSTEKAKPPSGQRSAYGPIDARGRLIPQE